MKTEFGLSVSCSTLARHYHCLAEAYSHTDLAALKNEAPDANFIQMQSNAIKLVTKKMISGTIDKSEHLHDLAILAKVLILQQSIDLKRRWLQIAESRRADEIEQARLQRIEDGEEAAESNLSFRDRLARFFATFPSATLSSTTPENP